MNDGLQRPPVDKQDEVPDSDLVDLIENDDRKVQFDDPWADKDPVQDPEAVS